jgi:hypothetical protein
MQPFAAQARSIGRTQLRVFHGFEDREIELSGILALWDCSSASSFCKTASMMYACHDGFIALFTGTVDPLPHFVSEPKLEISGLCRGSSCVATLPPFSIKALIAASLGCCGLDRIGICLPYRLFV